MLLVIDNFDSFTYNVVQYLREAGAPVEVYQNDAIDLAGIETLAPRALVLAPGPGAPQDAGICLAAVRSFAGRLPILGVCLGLQCIAEAFGGRVVRAPELVHGKCSQVEHQGSGVFAGLPSPFRAARYHSLAVAEPLPADLEVTARTRAGNGESVVMGIRHRQWPVEGVQFHPESVATEWGHALLGNFVRYTNRV